jgi:Family of unknown function (DUF6338)
MEMQLSKFTIGLIFIFLPGILALIISERLTEHRERHGYELLAYALVLGCIAHVVYGLLQPALDLILRIHLEEDRWIDLMLDTDVAIQRQVVAYTAIIGAILGLLLAYITNRSWLHRFAAKLKISQKFAEVDVWTHLLTYQGPQWVVVRDHSKNLMYQGYVQAFSATEDTRELFLTNASVFANNTGKKEYDVAVLYLSFDKKDVTLEIF